MSGDLKIGDVCIVRIPDVARRCEQCKALHGMECTIREVARPALRKGCVGLEMGKFYICELPSSSKTAALHRTELVKKDPPKDDTDPRVDFTPADDVFREDLQRQLNKSKVST